MSTWRIYMLGSTRVHKCSRRPCMPEYGSESWTLHLYVCICICEACERYLSMELSVMKIIGVDFDVVWIFCSFNDVFISSYTFKMFWKLIGLLSSYYNRDQHSLLKLAPLQPSSTLAYIASDFLVLPLSPLIIIHIHIIFVQHLHFIIQRILPLTLSFDIVPLDPLAPELMTRLSAGTQIPMTQRLVHIDYIIESRIQAATPIKTYFGSPHT